MVCCGQRNVDGRVVTCQVTQPDEELYNALAWDNTRPCCSEQWVSQCCSHLESQRQWNSGLRLSAFKQDSAGVVEAKVYAAVTV